MSYTKLNSEQIKVIINATQLFEAYEQLLLVDRRFNGTMHWKKIGGREYLYKGFSGGKTTSLGRRSPSTEKIKADYQQNRIAHRTQKKELRERILLHAGYARINRLNRFPLFAARIIRALQQEAIPFRVIGTHALYAYEIAAGVQIMPDFLATDDIDFLMDERQSMKIISALGKKTLLSILVDTDKSFKKLTSSPFEFAAVNSAGERAEFITQGSGDILRPNLFLDLLQKDEKPHEIDLLKWHIASPSFSVIVFDQKGVPLRVNTVDPRSFVIHKWYVNPSTYQTQKRCGSGRANGLVDSK